jgi:CelD/BcsL family acetyltransferase involved in cellulose biosynthesis
LPLSVEWVTEPAAFEGLAGEWDAIEPDTRPFDLHCWYSCWWGAFGSGGLETCTVRRDGELVGVFPLRREGTSLVGMANSHSGAFRPLARDGEAMSGLLEEVASRCQGMAIEALPASDPSVEPLEEALRGASMLPILESAENSPIVDTRRDFHGWRKAAHSSWKSRLLRYRRKMNRDYEAELSIVTRPADLEAELDAGLRLEASGWKGEQGTAILSAPETESFYREMAAAFHERGELRFNRIVLDGKLVAFSFCIHHGDRLYSLKAGFDESYRKIVPGLVIQISIVERCFEDDAVAAYELLGNRTDWKAKLATDDRPLARLRTVRRTPGGLAAHAYRSRLRPVLKRAYRRVRPVPPPS